MGAVELTARLRRLGESVWWIEELDPELVASAARQQDLFGPGLDELVPAYDVLAVYGELPRDWRVRLGNVVRTSEVPKCHRLPICYELNLDLEEVCAKLGVEVERFISIHLQAEFVCMAMGFQPGFGYLGLLPATISGVPRLSSPRPRLEPGSVGIQGDQTAVYPQASAGGWNIIGRCPANFGNREDGFLLSVGDRVQFERVTVSEFNRMVEPT